MSNHLVQNIRPIESREEMLAILRKEYPVHNTPRIEWSEVDDDFDFKNSISESKTIVLFNQKKRDVLTLGFIELCDCDEDHDGHLIDLYGCHRLDWKDFTHWSYACLPEW